MNTLKAMTLFGVTIALAATVGNDTAVAGIDAGGSPKSSRGSVSAFGSIYVNGVRYNTDNALFIIDGALGTEADLAVGMVVTVYGYADATGTTGTASVVISNNAVTGPVSGVDVAAGRMVVLGQSVIVGTDSSFSTGIESLADLNTGDVVEVSGHVNAYGEIAATHIGAAVAGDNLQVTGPVAFVDDATYMLGINGLLVDYSAANLTNFSDGAPAAGEIVLVTANGIDAGGVMTASEVSAAQPAISGAVGDGGDIEGLVTSYVAPWSFAVDGTPIMIRWGTRFEGGWVLDLGLDRKLEIEGEFDDAGRLVADRIIFESEATQSIRGHVDAVNGDTVIVDGVAVRMRDDTAYEDDSDYDERRFTAADLRAGDYVEVAAYSDDGQVIATRLERDDDDEEDDDD